jgi:pimeloyl-ACP methyl ester carboxylesterase
VSVPKHLQPDPAISAVRMPAASGELAALLASPDPAEGGPTRPGVLLVPGYTGSKEDFWHLLPPLAHNGRAATAVDLRGQCDSGGPEDVSAYTIEALAADVASLLAAASEPLHLVGHSFGGLVCRQAVLSGAPVRSLTLLGSGPGALSGGRADLVEVMRPMLGNGGVAEVWAALSSAATAGQPADVAAFLEHRFLGSPAAALLGMGESLVSAPDRVDELGAAGVPVLVACGENDDAWPPSVQREMAARLRAPFVTLAGAGHSPNVDVPDLVIETLETFWKSVAEPNA